MSQGSAQQPVLLYDAYGEPLIREDFSKTRQELTRLRRLAESNALTVDGVVQDGRVQVTLDEWPHVGPRPSALSASVTVAPDQKAFPIVPLTNPNTRVVTALQTYGAATAATLQKIEASPYNEQATGARRSIASSQAADTATGTGAREVALYYLDSNFQPQVEYLATNGVTAVPTVGNDIKYVERLVVTRTGSGGRNAGTITLFVNTAGGGGSIVVITFGALVAATGDNETLLAHHYVPAGVVSRISFISGQTTTTAVGYFFLKAKQLDLLGEVIISPLFLTLQATPFSMTMTQNPIVVRGPALITMFCVPAASSVSVIGSFDYADSPA